MYVLFANIMNNCLIYFLIEYMFSRFSHIMNKTVQIYFLCFKSIPNVSWRGLSYGLGWILTSVLEYRRKYYCEIYVPQYITIYKYIYLPKYKYYLFTYVNHELYIIYNNLFNGSLSVMAAKHFPFQKGRYSIQ